MKAKRSISYSVPRTHTTSRANSSLNVLTQFKSNKVQNDSSPCSSLSGTTIHKRTRSANLNIISPEILFNTAQYTAHEDSKSIEALKVKYTELDQMLGRNDYEDQSPLLNSVKSG